MSMRLGGILFILPFLFVFNPTLILHGDTIDILHDVLTACLAVWLLASALEGWLYWVGRIEWTNFRIPALLAAAALLYPGYLSDLVGLGIVAAMLLLGKTVIKKAEA